MTQYLTHSSNKSAPRPLSFEASGSREQQNASFQFTDSVTSQFLAGGYFHPETKSQRTVPRRWTGGLAQMNNLWVL